MRVIKSALRSIGVSAILIGSFGGVAAAAPSIVFVGKANCSDTAPNAGDTSNKPYCTIQKGVDSVSTGGTIRVAAGTYTENVNVNKSLSLIGAQNNQDTSTGRTDISKESVLTGNSSSGSLTVHADNVTVNGFTISGNTNGPGITSDSTHSGYHLLYNVFSNNVYGYYFGSNGTQPTTISRNHFDNNNQPGAGSGNAIYADQGANNATVNYNSFTSHANAAIILLSTAASATNDHLQISHNTTSGPGSFLILINGHDGSFNQNTGTGFSGSSAVFLGGSNGNFSINQNNLSGEAKDGTRNGFSGIRLTLDQQNYGNPDFVLAPNNDISIKQNTLTTFGDAGISIGSSNTAGLQTVTNGSIMQNKLLNNGNGEVDYDGGILIRSGNTGLKLNNNTATGNTNLDIEDNTTGSGTSGTGNTWLQNKCDTSTPTGLCTKTPKTTLNNND